jgi:hypothetical protein
MRWVELILGFLRDGFNAKIDMNALVFGTPGVNTDLALKEIDSLIQWNKDRKAWNERRLRAKMASAGEDTMPQPGWTVGDFGLDEDEVLHLQAESSDDEDLSDLDEDHKAAVMRGDLVEIERRRRAKGNKDETSRSSEPKKPEVVELKKLVPVFVDLLRGNLSQRIVQGHHVADD